MIRSKVAENATRSAKVSFVTQDILHGALVFGNRRFATRLIEQGHPAEFVAINGFESSAVESLPTGLEWFALRANRVRQAPWRLARHFRRSRPDVVFVSGFVQGLSCVLAARLMRHPPRIIIRAHVVSSIYLQTQTSVVDRMLLAPFLRYSMSEKVGFAAVSNDGARDLEKVLDLPLGTVSTLYDPVLPVESREQASFAHAWLDDTSTPLILSVGRLVPEKDFETLIRAFKIVLRDQPEWHLMILGEGDQRNRLECLVDSLGIGNSVAMPGFADTEGAYKRADLFVCSSVTEGLSNAIVEALAAGCPVVSTDCPVGPSEILLRGALGQLVPVGDPDALAAAILSAPSKDKDQQAALLRVADFHIDQVWPRFAELAGIV